MCNAPSFLPGIIYSCYLIFLQAFCSCRSPITACQVPCRHTPRPSTILDPMHFTNTVAAASLLAISAYAWQPSSTNGTDKLAHQGLANLKKHHAALNSTTSCDIGSAVVRKEWLSLSNDEKIAYIDAVKCLQDKPSLSGAAAPGAKSRFDDFVAVHINQTFFIHATVRVLSYP